ncbi:LacI family DNA-binding transcriptional regulator [Gracilibacillus kekensis]|uniref:Transcriptional regulator, LacI family n=1 Tax=Gracilibacillus kekensis TaxID=1027249 RepID=A0A1M7QPV0_9BACI|nr:LacI family DNA-binding transcriptional regulator [Gracilibacillus kekensis]SHN33547.1 transcriptional regulator, LacI family [Gracilibacillus kekensis]
MKITIKEIAKKAGVSTATVSKVIHNYQDVGENTRLNIIRIMNETGYQVKTRKVIGVIYGIHVNYNHPFFSEVMNSFSKQMGELGYDLMFFTGEDIDDYYKKCKEAQVDGCVILGGDEIKHSIRSLDKSDIPCIGIDIELTGKKSGYIMADNIKLGKMVVEHFYLLGHRNIGYIGGLPDTIIGSHRTQGFIQAMSDFGLSLNQNWIHHGDFTKNSSYLFMKELLKDNELPSAIFVASDVMAMGVIEAMEETKLAVPEDIAVIGCDDIELSKYINPPLTTIRQDKSKVGRLASLMLVDLMNGVLDSSSVMVESDLVVRQSCGGRK